MAGGLAALLDDVAMIAKMASAASTKAVAVVVDDTAVTPQYVQGFSPARELPMIWRIAKGSILNKLVILTLIIPLSIWAPMLLTPLLMVGGAYLCYEGVEKLWELVRGHGDGDVTTEEPVIESGPERENAMVKQAITTDFILSAEIMVISLATVATAPVHDRVIALLVTAVLITALVYGVVGLLVKVDDIGLRMSEGHTGPRARVGRLLVDGMPVVMNVLSAVGIIAMLWVGGHIIVSGLNTLGWHLPHHLIASLAEPAEHVHAALGWLVDTALSLVAGVLVGAVVVAVLAPLHKLRHVHAARTAR